MALDKFSPYLFVSAGEQSNKYLTPTITNGIAQFQAQRVQSLAGLTVRIEPIQEGTGDPSPTNVRPISGRTGLTVTAAGANLLPMPITSGSYANGVTVTLNDDKSFFISKTSSSGWTTFELGTFTLPAGTYMLIESDDNNENASISLYSSSGEVINTRYTKLRSFTLNEATTITRATFSRSAVASNVLTKLMLFVGSSATAADYKPYNATAYPITWESIAGVVYGGTLDVVSGVLTVTHASYDLAALDWRSSSPDAHIFRGLYPTVNPPKEPSGLVAADAISSEYTVKAYSPLSAADDGKFGLGAGKFIIVDHRYSAIADFVAHIADVQMVAKLATPQTYQLTPTEVRTIAGFNQIYSDAGPVIDIKF